MNGADPADTSPLGPSLGGQTASQELVVEFPSGIPGFEACRRFVLVTAPDLAPLACLSSLDPPEASFLVIAPTALDRGYDLTLRQFERARIGAGNDPLLWLAIVSVAGGVATANLRAPVVINPRRMLGCQFIRDEEKYAVSFPLGPV